MSKRRMSAEICLSDDEQTNLFQPPAKRARLDSCGDILLQHLPNELIVEILVKAVILEVMRMKLAKRVWKEKANLVINRLRPVSPHWNEVLATNYFRNKVHTILESTVQSTFRLEVLYESPVSQFVESVAVVRDEMFLLHMPDDADKFIIVHDRNNMLTVNDVIPLPEVSAWEIIGCSVTNCVYVHERIINWETETGISSILRITKDEGQRYVVSPWLSDPNWSMRLHLYVSMTGNLLVVMKNREPTPSEIRIYDARGSLQHVITLFPKCREFNRVLSAVQKSDGNLILAHYGPGLGSEGLKEVDTTGRLLRTRLFYGMGSSGVKMADSCGRIWTGNDMKDAELFDSELNRLVLNVPNHDDDATDILGMHYNSYRSETVRLCATDEDGIDKSLTIFRFIEE